MNIGKSNFGAARAYVENLLGGPINETESNPSIGTAVSSLVLNSPDRVGLLFMNMGSGTAYVGLGAGVSSTNGISLAPTGGYVSMNVTTDFTLSARQWFAVVPSGGPSLIYVLEIVRITKP